MSLTTEQIELVNQWLKEKIPDGLICSACQNKQWTITGIVVAPPFKDGNLTFDGEVVPVVQMVCTNCRRCEFFAAVPIGLVPSALESRKAAAISGVENS